MSGWGSFRRQTQADLRFVLATGFLSLSVGQIVFCQIVVETEQKGTMKNIKFVVKANRGGAHAPQYVLRIDRLPIQTTTNRKLALIMGRFTAEDAVKSMQNSHCSPELVSVRVSA